MSIQDFKTGLDNGEGMPMRNRAVIGFLSVLLLLLLTVGCQKAYYNTMEKFGVHKRDIMVGRVEEARDSQEDAKEQFQSALEQFTTVLDFKGGKLEDGKTSWTSTPIHHCGGTVNGKWFKPGANMSS